MLTYETGKAAVIGLTRQMAIDFGPMGITVNAIAPGHIMTENMQRMWREQGNEKGYRLFELQYPVRRTGSPDDIAHAVAFLCSPQAAFINGVLLPDRRRHEHSATGEYRDGSGRLHPRKPRAALAF